MQWFLVLTATVAAALGLAYLIGSLLPREHTARVDAVIPGSRADVWSAMTEPDAFPRWRPGVEEVEVLEEGPEAPIRWREEGRTGSMILEVVGRDPPGRLVVRIADPELPFGGRWIYELEPVAGGTRVRITEEGTIENPLLRFLARFVLGYEATMRDYLEGLSERMADGAEEGGATTGG